MPPPDTSALSAWDQWSPIVALKANAIVYPLCEVVHLVAIGLLFGTIFLVDLRLLGFMRQFDANVLARAILPWTLLGFVVAVLSGLTLFAMRIGEMLQNPFFIAKICLLFAAGSNAAVLHARGPLDPGAALTRGQAGVSLLIWVAAIFCGRWIAYV